MVWIIGINYCQQIVTICPTVYIGLVRPIKRVKAARYRWRIAPGKLTHHSLQPDPTLANFAFDKLNWIHLRQTWPLRPASLARPSLSISILSNSPASRYRWNPINARRVIKLRWLLSHSWQMKTFNVAQVGGESTVHCDWNERAKC